MWYKVTNIVQLYSPYLAIRTPGLSSIFFDDFSIECVTAETRLNPADAVVPMGAVPQITDNKNSQNNSGGIISNDPDNISDGAEDEVTDIDGNSEKTKTSRKKVRVVIKKSGNTADNTVIIVIAVTAAAVLAVLSVFIIIRRKKKRETSK